MDRDQVIAILRSHESELRAAGVEHLALFGSVVRGEETQESDVDLAADFSSPKLLNLFQFAGVQSILSDVLGTQVDLSERQFLKPAIRDNFERERILVY